MEYYDYLNDQIKKIIDTNKENAITNYVIYPFGKQGLLVKQILNWRYGIEEAFILDEGLSKCNPNIKALDDLKTIDTSKYCFIITSDNLQCYEEIRGNIRRYVDESNIVDLFSNKPLMSREPRLASLELASREIYDKNILGAVAEAGVYKGEFAKYINKFFGNRKMYLFDTFEGFDVKDIMIEYENNYTLRNSGHFSDTSVELVMRKMDYPDNVIIRKGYFPDTAEGIDEVFCFVSLDMDLYAPIKAGLEFFYPKITKGGYIFVHDCCIGQVNYKGARKALLEFCEKENIGYVMLPDNSTAVIVK